MKTSIKFKIKNKKNQKPLIKQNEEENIYKLLK